MCFRMIGSSALSAVPRAMRGGTINLPDLELARLPPDLLEGEKDPPLGWLIPLKRCLYLSGTWLSSGNSSGPKFGKRFPRLLPLRQRLVRFVPSRLCCEEWLLR